MAIWHQLSQKNRPGHPNGVNAPLATMHNGPISLSYRLMDEKNARGIFQYEDHQVYRESGEVVETWMVYCNEFLQG